MVLDNFKEKFEKLIKILTTDEKIAEVFSSIDTVDESFDFACSLVGEMDRNKYHSAVKDYIKSLDSDQECIFDSSLEDSIDCHDRIANAYNDSSSNDSKNNSSDTIVKKSAPDCSSFHYRYKKISSSDEKKISGGVLFKHRKMHI